ncbi:hypothetical protein N7509_012719 [Penicillium cosmopolitanum]|uniref:Uncharacterized protein n=1 Tax=Penicillium cosmopolitanum TaxID=1131564 RepID=A0A9W9VHG3_9EURO|nr:uncharacterized protein N7509_012719 [Penicillium cosmopolitanum]KAJ5379600.1 hypothetical protein N7509_012719 [Penicillium cosmopolitanum]
MTGDRPKWKALLLKENERCQSRGTKLPSETYFNEDIQAQCLELQSSETLVLLLFQIADANAFTFLQEAIFASKTTEIDKPRKVSMEMSTGDRFNIMDKLDGDITFNALLKRYHLMELFRNSGGRESGGSMVIIPVYADSSFQRPGRKGNPISNACADVTQRMMTETFPSLRPGTREYDSKKVIMKRYRVLASRFQVFVDKFGLAILCFIQPFQGTRGPSWGISDNKIREINDTNLKAFIDILDQSQGDYLRSVCKAAEPLLSSLIYTSSSKAAEFPLERIETADILQLPKGSDDLLFLLRDVSRDGSTF